MKTFLLFLEFILIIPILTFCFKNDKPKKWIYTNPKEEITFRSKNKYLFKFIEKNNNIFKFSVYTIKEKSSNYKFAIANFKNIENVYLNGKKLDINDIEAVGKIYFLKYPILSFNLVGKENIIEIEYKKDYYFKYFSFINSYISYGYKNDGTLIYVDCLHIEKMD